MQILWLWGLLALPRHLPTCSASPSSTAALVPALGGCSGGLGRRLGPQRPHRLVVRTSRCGRDNPGSTPGVVIFLIGIGASCIGSRVRPRELLADSPQASSTDSAACCPTSEIGWMCGLTDACAQAWLVAMHARLEAFLPAAPTRGAYAWCATAHHKLHPLHHFWRKLVSQYLHFGMTRKSKRPCTHGADASGCACIRLSATMHVTHRRREAR